MSGLASWSIRFWSSRFHPRRAYLFTRGTYLLLAFDLCFEMIEHGGRYGIGGFNVAHFTLLDRALPLPSTALYVGLLIASAGLSLQLALGRAARALPLLLAGLYTLSWMLSMHDSYQHHYLLSWLLVWCAACPAVSAEQAEKGELLAGWGLPMAALTCAIVYVFTAISKSEAGWRNGDVLRVLSHSRPPGHLEPGKFDAARDLLLGVGISEAAAWQLFALATIALQWLVALGYLVATQRDERPTVLRGVVTSVGLLCALSFHALAEIFQVFEIGLFSYYMIWIALVLLAPAGLLAPLTSLLAVIARHSARISMRPVGKRHVTGLVCAATALTLLVALGFAIPLPGARWALVLLSLVALMRYGVMLREGRRAELERVSLTTVLSALFLWLTLTQTDIPFDYYRRTAGELSRMGRLEEAIQMYRRAEQHAPPGKSRMRTIRELERRLAKQHET